MTITSETYGRNFRKTLRNFLSLAIILQWNYGSKIRSKKLRKKTLSKFLFYTIFIVSNICGLKCAATRAFSLQIQVHSGKSGIQEYSSWDNMFSKYPVHKNLTVS